jgi:hypothetical protein
MKSKTYVVPVLLVTAALLAGCASSTKPTAYTDMPQSAQMKPNESDSKIMSYRNPDTDIARYHKVLLVPVEIYTGTDAEFKDASPEQQKEMADYLYSETTKALNDKGLLATEAGPDVARLKLYLGGLEKTKPVASGVTHLLPIGLAINIGKGVMGKNGAFMGTATVGGEVTDSVNGTLIASFLVKEAPNAMDIPAAFTGWEASKKALSNVAHQISDRVEQTKVSQR